MEFEKVLKDLVDIEAEEKEKLYTLCKNNKVFYMGGNYGGGDKMIFIFLQDRKKVIYKYYDSNLKRFYKNWNITKLYKGVYDSCYQKENPIYYYFFIDDIVFDSREKKYVNKVGRIVTEFIPYIKV